MKTWLPTKLASEELSIGIRTLERMKAKGFFEEGKHYIKRNPSQSQSALLWHRERCLIALNRV
jgi:hypothetical protein